MALLHVILILTTVISVARCTAVGAREKTVEVQAVFGPVHIFDPPQSWTSQKLKYARVLELDSGSLLATWAQYTPASDGLPWFPIYKSDDGGHSWYSYSTVNDTVNGWGMTWEPMLYKTKHAHGPYPPGTILASGLSVAPNLNGTRIDVYASMDDGYSWKFASNVAVGGEAKSVNGYTPVWEPFLFEFDKHLICYYSDQRDPSHGQKISHQTTADLTSWGPVVTDVAYETYSARPGMATVSKIPGGKYFLTYEYGGAPEANYAVYYRISDNPLNFNDAPGQVLRATDGVVPTSSPYNIWVPGVGPNGTLLVNALSSSDVYVNTNLGYGQWTAMNTSAPASYTRSMTNLRGQRGRVLIVGGGPLGNGATNYASATEVSVGVSK